MKNELKILLDKYLGSTRENPSKDEVFEFLQVLSQDGQLLDYSEQDWIEAGKSAGLTDDDIANWIETAASWLDDTTEEGKYEPEPAVWAQK